MQPRRADVGTAMVAHRAQHAWLQFSKGHVVWKAASVDLRIVVTVRIAAANEDAVSSVASYIGQPHGLVVQDEVRDRPGHCP